MTEAHKQIKKNESAYLAREKELEALYPGKVLLMHDGEVINAYNDDGDAYSIGCEKYGLRKFSLRRVSQQPVDIGFAVLDLIHMEGLS